MGRCRQCEIEILDETERCPLCNCVLEPTIEVENMYPNVRTRTRILILISRIYLFCMILAEALLIYLNIVLESQIWWSAITGFSMLYGYLLIRFAILGKSGYMSKMIVLIINTILLAVAIDFVLGYQGWSINYALPAGIIAIDIAIVVLMIVNRRNWQSYIMLQLFMILCSMISLILYAGGILKSQPLVLIALAVSVFLFLGTLIIGDRRARVELKRRFHI